MQNLKKRKQEKYGDYIIRRTIGKGTFSKVKLGINVKTNKKVAIKILEKSKILEKEDLERILREMEMLKKFNHPNVIETYEISETPKSYLIIMEYCEGGELFNYIVKKENLSEEESSFFFYQILNGLEYIHSKGIIHRDLKPENLLLTKNNKLKIIDFGLSNYFDGKNLLQTPCGSPCYASPEMVSGENYNGFFSDIWALGIILFAMTCGYLPFEDKDNDVLFEKIINCDFQFPNHLSPLCRDLISKILNTNPQERINIQNIKKHKFYLMGKKIFEEKFKDENDFKENYFNISNNINHINFTTIPTISNNISNQPILTEYNTIEENIPYLYKDYFENGKLINKNKINFKRIKNGNRRYYDLNSDIKFISPNRGNFLSQNISNINNSSNRSKFNSMMISTDYEISDYAKKININKKKYTDFNLFKLNLHRKNENNNIIFKPKFLFNHSNNNNKPVKINKNFYNMIPFSFNSKTTDKITQRINNKTYFSMSEQSKLPAIYKKEKNYNIHLANKYPLRTDENFIKNKMLKFNLEKKI